MQNPKVTPNATTTYYVTVTSGTASANASVAVTVNPTPETPTITNSGSSLTATESASYQWYLNGNAIDGANSRSYSPTLSGSYTVIVKNAFGCASEVSPAVDFTYISVDETQAPGGIRLYPNPTTGTVAIDYAMPVTITVLNTLGTELMAATGNSIDLSALENGIYFLRISDNGKILKSEKIVLIK
jgi:hypothetical protein